MKYSQNFALFLSLLLLIPIIATAQTDSDNDGLPDIDEQTIYYTDHLDPDTDNDGIWDGEEINIGTSPLDADTDDDGISDSFERDFLGTLPYETDSDWDGLPDGLELGYITSIPGGISDGTGIIYNGTDLNVFYPDGDSSTTTNPMNPDSDQDTLDDGDEDINHNGVVDMYETDPNNGDMDNDGLPDGYEYGYGTDPFDPDSDGDFWEDGDEVNAGCDPTDADTDDDGVPDWAELVYSTLWNNIDSDGDGLLDGQEIGIDVPYFSDTDLAVFVPDSDPSTTTQPDDADTDDDNLDDGVEDADLDGAVDSTETDPNNPDTDNDTYEDGYEVEIGSDPLDPQSTPPDLLSPNFVSISDVPDDQGRFLRLSWLRTFNDAPNSEEPVTGYGIYRRINGSADNPEDKLAGYDTMGWISAHGDSIYNFVATTTCDSTASGLCWSVFFVRATTANPFVFYDTEPDSGYSIDNLAPTVPTGLNRDSEGLLVWNPAPEMDFDYFSVYGSTQPVLDETATIIGHTTTTSYGVQGLDHHYFLVTARDAAGNEGGAAVLEETSATNDGLPTHFSLNHCSPNPFNPQTTISYDLPELSPVRLCIHDIAGRLVRTLVDSQAMNPGHHNVVWDGRDATGQAAAAGVYFYRLEAGNFSDAQRMVLVK